MTYDETLHYLYTVAPLFQNIGGGAYKEGLHNTRELDAHFAHPHRRYRTIHVAGTNGKGSVSHTLAAVLQTSGLRVGLYTSPHLVDFRERIRVNGEPIPKQRVVDFVAQERPFFEPLHPSFFELTTALAFLYFAEQEVDVAVIEVGLGGRLDCTNIITPTLSVITNISFDHTQFLGTTLPQIATEKAGIIKPRVPVVIGEAEDEAVREVFSGKAREQGAPIVFAKPLVPTFPVELKGFCQRHNTATTLTAIECLRRGGYDISDEAVREGFANVCRLTGLRGRWQQLGERPLVICDTGHNPAGIALVAQQLRATPHERLHIVLGMVGDKDVTRCLSLLPREAQYYFTQASVHRAMPAHELAQTASTMGLTGEAYATVSEAHRAALAHASERDLVFIGGSSFVVADLLASIG